VSGEILKNKAAGGTITYPEKNGRQLKLTFTAQAPDLMNHYDARKYCADKQLRLPTIRELFDFCSNSNEFEDTRCEGGTWSVSRDSSSTETSWIFLDKLSKDLPKEKHGLAIYYANRKNCNHHPLNCG
jgi:hypothetical protein